MLPWRYRGGTNGFVECEPNCFSRAQAPLSRLKTSHLAAGPTGYNVRRDISPERLTLTCEVFADRFASPRANLALHALNVRQACFVAVEAFGETGVSTLSRIVRLPTSRRCPAHPDPASSIGRLPPLELRAGRLCPPGEIVGKTGKGTIDRGTPLADGHGLVAQSFGDVADGECA